MTADTILCRVCCVLIMSDKSLTTVSIEALKSKGRESSPTFHHNFLYCLKRCWVPLWWVGAARRGGQPGTTVLYYCLNRFLGVLILRQPVNSCRGEQQNVQLFKELYNFLRKVLFLELLQCLDF